MTINQVRERIALYVEIIKTLPYAQYWQDALHFPYKQWLIQNKKKVALWALATPFLSILMLFILVRLGLVAHMPGKQELEQIRNPQASTLYGSNNQIIGLYFKENRTSVDSSQIIKDLKNALVATEDVRFYEHSGIDFKSLGRVFIKTILMGQHSAGGGSTLTQQVAKNIYGRKNYWLFSSLVHKFREMIVARKLESTYSKDEILLMYLNTVSFGEEVFGIEKACKRFFNKKPTQLKLEEAATLVGMLKAPTNYSPRLHPDRCIKRRNVVLDQMVKYGFLSEKKAVATKKKKLRIDYQNKNKTLGNETYFKKFVEDEFNAWAEDNPKDDGSAYNLHMDGLKIYVTLSPNMQRVAERNMAAVMRSLQRRFDQSWEGGMPFGNNDSLLIEMIKASSDGRELLDDHKLEEVIRIMSEVKPRTTWEWQGGFKIKPMSSIDSIKHYMMMLHNGVLAMRPNDGAIIAYVGGNDYRMSQYDNVTFPRQVGSTFKPIAYLAALQNGVSPCKVYTNEKKVYDDYEGWTPKNANGKYGGSFDMFSALASSINTVAVKVILDAGINKTIDLARKMGISTELPEVPSLVLGTADIPMIELVAAYCSFANGGKAVKPYCILKIEDRNGKIIFEREKVDQKRIMTQREAQIIQAMLQEVSLRGTGSNIMAYGITGLVAGKTGTTQNQSDGWYVGMTPNLVIGSWVGTLDKRMHFKDLGSGAGGSTALPIVGSIFRDLSVYGGMPVQSFQIDSLGLSCFTPSLQAIPVDSTSIEESGEVVVPDSTAGLLQVSEIDTTGKSKGN